MQLSLPRLVVGGDYEGGLTPVALPISRGICFIWELLLYIRTFV